MELHDLYTELSYGELSNLAMAEAVPGEIRDKDKPKVTMAANEALLRLHSRFILKQNDVVFQMFSHITNYHLKSRFSHLTEPRVQPYPYIMDSPRERFEDDVIKVLEVWSSYGRSIPLNDAEQPFSVFTPQLNVVQVPNPMDGAALSVVYQARHAKLVHTDLEQAIELPDVLYGALRAYTAYKVYSQINTQEAGAKAMEHMEVYEAICVEIEEGDLVDNSVSTTNTRFEKRGWV